MDTSTICQSKWKSRWAKSKTYRQAQTHWLKFYDEAVIESEAFKDINYYQEEEEYERWL